MKTFTNYQFQSVLHEINIKIWNLSRLTTTFKNNGIDGREVDLTYSRFCRQMKESVLMNRYDKSELYSLNCEK